MIGLDKGPGFCNAWAKIMALATAVFGLEKGQ